MHLAISIGEANGVGGRRKIKSMFVVRVFIIDALLCLDRDEYFPLQIANMDIGNTRCLYRLHEQKKR